MADNEFGYTAWGKDWLRLAEPLRQDRPDPLLPRARSVARNNGVPATVDGRIVRVTIHRGSQASVTHLEIAPLPRATVTAIATLIPDTTVLTDEMYRMLRDADISPAPAIASTDCSCSARNPRCLHLLALLYEITRRVDQNPRLALELQGYFEAAQDDSDIPVEMPQWVPINSLDPAEYFGEVIPLG
ncbi:MULTISPECIES: SWIM zinc finger family protein [unclassified Nocardia]|uniref:SWIM zinc finger family protein n=1 Tax=unclassified Nocardia TaxID=2637762 RepID=UPI001CE3CB28|nr:MULTISPECIES: SWIM zinc finger family protein [unclassified Nocardia]